MNKLGFMALFACALAFALSACGQNTGIANRWSVAGQMIHGQIIPLPKSKDFEFLKNGQFNFYEKEVIVANGKYTTAGDKKSVLLKDGRDGASMEIIELKGAKLVMIFSRSRYDTLVCYAYASASQKAAKQKEIAYNKARMSLYDLTFNYTQLHDWLFRIYTSVPTASRDKDIFVRLNAAIKEYEAIRYDMNYLLKDKVAALQAAQTNMVKSGNEIMAYANTSAEVSSSAAYKGFLAAKPSLDKGIETARVTFDNAYSAFIKK